MISFGEMKQNLIGKKSEVDKAIYSLIQQYTDWQGIVETLSEIGTRSGIEKEIKKIKEEKDKLSKELSLSDDDISKYDEAMKSIADLKGAIFSNDKYCEHHRVGIKAKKSGSVEITCFSILFFGV